MCAVGFFQSQTIDRSTFVTKAIPMRARHFFFIFLCLLKFTNKPNGVADYLQAIQNQSYEKRMEKNAMDK